MHMMEMIASVAAHVSSDCHRKSLVQHATEFRELSQTTLTDEPALGVISDRYRELIRLVEDDEYRKHVTRTNDWSS